MPTPQEIHWLRQKYKGKETPGFKRDLRRLAQGEHIDYVIGFAEFLGCKIDLSARPLIPRPETEFWTERVIEAMRALTSVIPALSRDPKNIDSRFRGNDKHTRQTSKNSPLRVLDLFSGSGCIGLSVLKHISRSKVDFADVETAYFPGIRKSARWNNIPASRFRTIHSDVLRGIKERYDYILANPPYIASAGRFVQRSVLEQEPHTALFGGRDGLKFIRALIKDGKSRLNPGGQMIIEFDPPQKTRIGALGRRYGYRVIFSKDQYGRYRYCYLKL